MKHLRSPHVAVCLTLVVGTWPARSARSAPQPDPVAVAIQNWQKVWQPLTSRSSHLSKLPEYQSWLQSFRRLQSTPQHDPNYPRYADTEARSWEKNKPAILAAGKREFEVFIKNAPRYREAEFQVLELMADDLRQHLQLMSQAGLYDFWSQLQPERTISDIQINGYTSPSAYFLRQKRYLPFLQRQPLTGCRVMAYPVVRDCTPEETRETPQQFQEAPQRKVLFVGFILQLDSHSSLVTVGDRWEEDPVRVRYLLRIPSSFHSDGEENPRRERDFLRAGKYKVLFFQAEPEEEKPRHTPAY